MLDTIKKKLNELKNTVLSEGSKPDVDKSEEDEIKAKYKQDKKEPSLTEQVAQMKIKYGASSDKGKSFDEKVKAVKQKYRDSEAGAKI